MKEIGEVFAAKFKNFGITKVVTIEASGLLHTLYWADALEVPMIFFCWRNPKKYHDEWRNSNSRGVFIHKASDKYGLDS